MNSFKRKALAAAVFAGLGSAGVAHAVHVNPAGLGQFLIYPYYTVQQANGNAFNTYVTVVNTTTTGKAVKVRFREGKTSREVLDFNLFLSPNDVWVAAIIPADSTTASGGRLITPDHSCTNPAIPATGVDFRNYAMGDAADPVKDTSLARTREGYVEMYEVATVIDVAPRNQLTGITHDATGFPADCTTVQGASVVIDTAPPTGGLFGTGTLINVNNGEDMGYKAVALANFRTSALAPTLASEQANVGDADPWSLVTTASATGERIYRSNWAAGRGVDAVSSTLMSASVANEYILDAGTLSATDWVNTFPTKRYYYASATPFTASTPFTTTATTAGACEVIGFAYVNREERGAAATGADFSPTPPAGSPSQMCWESNILSIRNATTTATSSAVLGSVNETTVTITTGAQNGWGKLTFSGTNATTVGLVSAASSLTDNWTTNVATVTGAQTYLGLPVTGFMVRTFNNGTLTCGTASCQGNYGSAFEHNYIKSITPTP